MPTYIFDSIEETFDVPDAHSVISVRPTQVTMTFPDGTETLDFITDFSRSEYDGFSLFSSFPVELNMGGVPYRQGEFTFDMMDISWGNGKQTQIMGFDAVQHLKFWYVWVGGDPLPPMETPQQSKDFFHQITDMSYLPSSSIPLSEIAGLRAIEADDIPTVPDIVDLFVSGTDAGDMLAGGEGNDTLDGGNGNDILEGGNGVDTAVYAGEQGSYTLTLSPAEMTVTDRRGDGDGTDQLVDIEFLSFGPQGNTFDLTKFAGTAGLSEEKFESFVELYIAYFNRSPDAVGLNFWGTAYANGTSLEEMAEQFTSQAETQAAYPADTTNEEFAQTVYDNLFGRTPDQAGFEFWVETLDKGVVTRDQFILEVLRGVQDDSTDRAFLDNKVDLGAYFAVHKGMSDVGNASAAMALFDGSQASIDAAVTAIDGYHAAASDAQTGEFLMPLVGVLDDPFMI
ncbi:DUF4214 domain-containing protein [Sulfitobacter sp. KE34]|uniref:DUF4214 domain-containing protein n=1 Tax=unclassified Sulfitobacter TaxID=196795 RepID=UPI0023E29677|nr:MULTISPECIES: DUF4214 domain-containing protein [unclassified Sulfitobacter]MDF3352075.1 DUF4214 domain-containing protein [Sulfitobacter sp. KE12]MDF3355687.1 DUF4214 domain-containing protein [Sulfitobacter sp. KE27]MDF3359387.1 DUF4214 domain-containing protein [Sulfitobacter sp. KE33]MDF3366817.1 DUF4214 domain-containing protein [Sulfitobacter sp. Ks34]MDF3370368.1 DUF4214 domain-containing protein [Sulfitobacter sp. Ks43]